MEIFGIAVTMLAAILTYQAWKNGRWMKQAHQDTQALIKEMHEDTNETLKKMDETLKEMQKRTDETLKEIAKLIVAEGEKTRQAIRS